MEKLVERVMNISCINNCSGHGECIDGICICEIRYEGAQCRSANASYFASLASVFLTLALVCLVQLVTCVMAERRRMKAPSLARACRVTTQKLLYLLVFLASLLRGAYFTYPDLSVSLVRAFYPLLLSGSSLVVCFWAEVFHLRDVRWEKSQFLSKSFVGFVVFNLIAYSLLVAEFYTLHYLDTPPHLKNFYIHVFNGCYAVLLFIVVTFFLIYGVQVFFKVRGGFLLEIDKSIDSSSDKKLCRSSKLEKQIDIDVSQLHQSRLGLLSQTLMLASVAVFLSSETLSEFWKYKAPLHSRNWHDLLFRLVEIGVALWFPCVLWNCMSPEQLWILNPKRIIKSSEEEEHSLRQTFEMALLPKAGQSVGGEVEVTVEGEGDKCFMCQHECRRHVCHCKYAHDPCICQFGQRAAHDNFVIGSDGQMVLVCTVCRVPHPTHVRAGKPDWPALVTSRPFLLWLALLVSAVGACAYAFVRVAPSPSPPVGLLTIGVCFLLIYIGVRNLWAFTDSAWQNAKSASRQVQFDSAQSARLNETLRLQRGGGGGEGLLPSVHRPAASDPLLPS